MNQDMRGVILAGGTGSRLAPLTRVTNKALLPVGTVPLIFRHLYLLRDAGIRDILVVTGPECAGDLMRVLGSGASEDVRLAYRIQDSANGIAAAMLMAQDFVGDRPFTVVLGDNLFFPYRDVARMIREFGESYREGEDYRLFTKAVSDPQRFGVCVFENAEVVDIVEKPKDPVPSDHAVVGLYCYGPIAFEYARSLRPSARGEYEITDVNRKLIQRKKGSFRQIAADWVDAGTHAALRRANQLAWNEEEKHD